MQEEIIIDGVNVAGCGYFCETDKECNICGMGTSGEDTFCRDCKDNSNCYYKQLKRLEQENKELKSTLEEIKKIIDCECCVFEGRDECNPNQCSLIENEINEVLGNEYRE